MVVVVVVVVVVSSAGFIVNVATRSRRSALCRYAWVWSIDEIVGSLHDRFCLSTGGTQRAAAD